MVGIVFLRLSRKQQQHKPRTKKIDPDPQVDTVTLPLFPSLFITQLIRSRVDKVSVGLVSCD